HSAVFWQLSGHPQGRSQPLELADTAVPEPVRDPIQRGTVALHRAHESLLKLPPSLRDQNPWPVGRDLGLARQQTIGAHRTQLVAQLKRERAMLVKNELEVERHVPQLVQQVGRLLQMGLTGPAAAVMQP